MEDPVELAIGDTVMYPKHGVGEITGIENVDLVDGYADYYVIEIPTKRMTVRIPIEKLDDLGVRPTMREAKLARVLETLSKEPTDLPKNNKKRQDGLRDKLGSGFPVKVAEAVRDLSWRKETAHLTKVDTDLLTWGKELLVGEIASVTDTDVLEAQQVVETVLDDALVEHEKLLQ